MKSKHPLNPLLFWGGGEGEALGSTPGVTFGFQSSLLPRRKTWIFAGFGGWVSSSFLEVGQRSWAAGPWAREPGWRRCPPTPAAQAAARWCLRNPGSRRVIRAPSSRPQPSRGGLRFSAELGACNSLPCRGRPAAFFKWRNLAFPSFVADFSHLKRALRHFKPVNGRALCAARWHLEPRLSKWTRPQTTCK